MKRAIGLALATAACIIALMSVRGTMPFVPVSGSSMEPVLHSGGLVTIKPVNPVDIKVGDIIVYHVPPAVRDYYNYPPTVSHRVIQIQTEPALVFRTGGDNTGEDPFTVRPMDIRGTAGRQIPYIGFPLFLFQGKEGLIFAIAALVLLALFLFRGEIKRVGSRLYRGIFSPVINEEKRGNRELSRKIEAAEKKMDATEQALLQFSSAIADYSRHLSSHTSAIQGLSEASHELKKGAAEQNRVLSAIMDNMVKSGPVRQEPVSPVEKPATTKLPPFHGALYKTETFKPDYKIEKRIPARAKPALERVRSIAESERLVVIAKKAKLDIEKLTSISIQSEMKTERIIPVADKLVFNARKPVQHTEEKTSGTEHLHPHHPAEKPVPPGCARQQQEQLWT
jgi:signal peptidase I